MQTVAPLLNKLIDIGTYDICSWSRRVCSPVTPVLALLSSWKKNQSIISKKAHCLSSILISSLISCFFASCWHFFSVKFMNFSLSTSANNAKKTFSHFTRLTQKDRVRNVPIPLGILFHDVIINHCSRVLG